MLSTHLLPESALGVKSFRALLKDQTNERFRD